MRNLKAWRALLASVAGFGLGYLYVGRTRLAFAVPLAILASTALIGWTRLILQYWGAYTLAITLLLLSAGALIHPMVIARREGSAPSSRWNRGWVYLVWIVGSFFLGGMLSGSRATLFGFEPFRIPSVSMSPTIQPGDVVMVDAWRYRFELPKYGDLAVFNLPDRSGVKYLFRVVGRPGDEIELRDSKLYRNGSLVEEPYLPPIEPQAPFSQHFGPVVLDDSSVFVLGDNRDNARDSRFIGPISMGLLHGRVEYRWFAYSGGIRWSRFPQKLNDET